MPLNTLIWVFIGIHTWGIFIIGPAFSQTRYIYKLYW